MTRLGILDHGHRRRARVAMRLIPLVAGTGLDDVGKTSLYRPELFGRPWLALLRDVMVGPSDWSRGERELLAAFVSNRNRCPYCVGIHTGTATIGLHREVRPELLDHWQEADFGPRLEAAFTLLAGVRDDPDHGAADAAAAARAAGLSDSAIVDAYAVAFVFDLVNRLADAFGYSFGDEAGRLAEARALYRLAYKVPGFLLG